MKAFHLFDRFLVASIVCLVPTISASSGDYAKTCSDRSIADTETSHNLTTKCATLAGSLVEASIAIGQCVGNQDGSLVYEREYVFITFQHEQYHHAVDEGCLLIVRAVARPDDRVETSC